MSGKIHFTHVQIFCILFGASALAEEYSPSAKAKAPQEKQ